MMLHLKLTTLILALTSCSALRGGARNLKQKKLTTVREGRSVAFSCQNGHPYGSDNKCTYAKEDWVDAPLTFSSAATLTICTKKGGCAVECDLSCLVRHDVEGTGGPNAADAPMESLGPPETIEVSKSIEFRCLNGKYNGYGNRCEYTPEDWTAAVSSVPYRGILDICINPDGCQIQCTKSCQHDLVEPGFAASHPNGASDPLPPPGQRNPNLAFPRGQTRPPLPTSVGNRRKSGKGGKN